MRTTGSDVCWRLLTYADVCCWLSQARSSEDEAYAHYWFVGVKFDKDRLKADGKKAPDIREPVNIFRYLRP